MSPLARTCFKMGRDWDVRRYIVAACVIFFAIQFIWAYRYLEALLNKNKTDRNAQSVKRLRRVAKWLMLDAVAIFTCVALLVGFGITDLMFRPVWWTVFWTSIFLCRAATSFCQGKWLPNSGKCLCNMF